MSDTEILEWRLARSRPGERERATSGAAGGIAGLKVPSIRMPVTAANREALREMRARELSLWEDSFTGRRGTPANRVEMPKEDRESQMILLVLAGAALALWLQTASAAVEFVERWETFRALVEGWVR